ncbi:MAG: amidohydrolase [Rhodobacteraceae bacterium]|jgi:5-methylthioadenosine/S-adenosylhomocysteine deaminase|uniref:amidohydrolase family protein n=1 Tax=Albidovulum sp. TaxID=1872424 RepID=UPI001DFE5EC7|nr:amidohydrolase [uncultured Defluviimonas sp.]MCB2125512.1 amidohydrolase [Paracoccaceae bacterium]MCC0071254.1 amidohydrolase [Paracoccaceae bacterium]
MTAFPARCDTLVTNGHVLTMDDAFTAIRDGAVAISKGRIAAIGPMAEAAGVAARAVIDARGGIVLPGFVNTHCHAAMVLFRGLADDRPLDGFLKAVWAAEAAHVTPETVRAGAALGLAEMALGGVTHVVDMYFHPDATVDAARHVGIGLTAGPVFIGFDGIDHLPWPERLRFAEAFVTRHRGTEGLDLMLMPHSAYTLDAAQLAEVTALSERLGVPVHIHAAEAPSEMALVAARHGTTPVRALDRAGMIRPGTLLAHAVHLDDAEIALLAERGVAMAHCPLSNAKLASGAARLCDLRSAGAVTSLGTDGAASGNDLDMFRTMRLAAQMAILASGAPDALPARDVVAMATREGARAAGLGARKGRLTAGMDADLIVVDLSSPHLIPSYDPYSSLVYAAGRSDVAHVMARGRPIVADRRIVADVTSDIAAVRAVASSISASALRA